MPARPALVATRRTALGGALLGLGATGCRLDRPDDPAAPGSAASAGADPDADPDPDAGLVEGVLAELVELTALTTVVARRFPPLRGPTRGLVRLHVAHREALGDEVAATSHDGAFRLPDAVAALALLRTRELRAQRRLVDSSVAAESGSLARLLSAMAAGVAQHVAVLPTTPGAGR